MLGSRCSTYPYIAQINARIVHTMCGITSSKHLEPSAC